MREVIVNATAQARIKGMVSILATTRDLIQAQLDDLPDETIAQLQRRLNQEYDAYTEKHGRLSSRANALAMREDSGYSLLCSLRFTTTIAISRRSRICLLKEPSGQTR